jgi:hypothetical protein
VQQIRHKFRIQKADKMEENLIPMVKMFWLSGTADYFETDYH